MILPLAPFEEYMLRDDRPSFPMDFFVRLRFSGRFTRSALQAAVQTTIARHALLRAVVRRERRGRLQWCPSDAERPEIQWLPGGADASFPPASAIDLEREPGMRLSVVSGIETSDLVAQFHHACCDGVGAIQFLEDLLATYARTLGTCEDSPTLGPLREEALRRRTRFGLSAPRFLKLLPKQLVGLLRVCKFLVHAGAPLAGALERPGDDGLPAQYPAVCDRRLTAEETSSLMVAAKRDRVTLNDLMVRDWFLAMGDFRSRHLPDGGNGRLRLAVPTNLRGPEDGDIPAANIVSMVFLDRRPSDLADLDRLLDGIHREMDQIKRCRLGLMFVFALATARLLPGCLSRMTRADRCLATAVLTNLGMPLRAWPLMTTERLARAGDVVLEAIDFLAPLRPHTHAAVGVLTYASRLHVALHYDPRAIRAAQADDLVEAFMTRLRASGVPVSV
ncbi:MAG: condensation domain-containing protein [Pirellulales bacterium]